ncbi:MAG: N-acetylmuramic acid 6-phosphate etherase [Phycisphaerales bacterium]|nr:N-acetylmuramic acid 6-phosphate etherase [Phycisphaerales bacterium]
MTNTSLPPDRSHLLTEQRNPSTMRLHELSVRECVDLIHEEDREVFRAMKRADHLLAKLIGAIEPGFLRGGRLIYVGAGTSGRLGVLDASEVPPTFQVDPGKVVGIIAGGDSALRRSSEGMEDDPRGAWTDLESLDLTDDDAVIGIAAGGTTPFVRGALEFCKTTPGEGNRPLTAMLVCVNIETPPHCDHFIVLKTGPEVITGSTRMKAGTATKLALNTISTTLMIRAGRVYENLMVDLRATNDKLRDRAARIISMATGAPRDESFSLLSASDGSVKTAIVMRTLGVDGARANHLLAESSGRLDRVLSSR